MAIPPDVRLRLAGPLIGLFLFVGAATPGFGQDAWREYRSPDEHFAMSFPGAPSESMKGDSIWDMSVRRVRFDDSRFTFFLNYGDYQLALLDREGTKSMLDSERDAFVSGVKGTSSNDRSVSCGRHAGRIFDVRTSSQRWYRVKLCIARPRMYLLYVSSEQAAITDPAATRFLDSFRILNAPGPAEPVAFDGRRLPQVVDSFEVYLIRGRDTTHIGAAHDELRVEGGALIRSYRQEDRVFGRLTATIVSRLADLRPVSYRGDGTLGSFGLRYTPTAVVGWVQAPRDSGTVNTPLERVVFEGATFDLLARASDLAAGLHWRASGFDVVTKQLMVLEGRVAGSVMVQGQECWVFDGSNDGTEVVFWIAKTDRSLRRSTIRFSAEATMMLVARDRARR